MNTGHRHAPFGQRAGLVERHTAHGRQALQVCASLDEHARARGGGQRRHNRHGSGDDQRTRTRHHEQHQRTVEPLAPSPGGQRQGFNRGDGRRYQRNHRSDDDHRGCVTTRKLIHKRLNGRTPGLRLLDQMNDARDRAVGREVIHADIKGAGAIDGPGKNGVARRLVCGPRFAGDWRLIHGRLPVCHRAIDRHPITGLHQHQVPHPQLGDGHTYDLPLAPDQRVGGSDVHHVADGAARTRKAQRLEPLRNAEQPDDHRRLEPLAESDRAQYGDHHQHVDVEDTLLEGPPRMLRGDLCCQRGGDTKGRGGHPGRPGGGHTPLEDRADADQSSRNQQGVVHRRARHHTRDRRTRRRAARVAHRASSTCFRASRSSPITW